MISESYRIHKIAEEQKAILWQKQEISKYSAKSELAKELKNSFLGRNSPFPNFQAGTGKSKESWARKTPKTVKKVRKRRVWTIWMVRRGEAVEMSPERAGKRWCLARKKRLISGKGEREGEGGGKIKNRRRNRSLSWTKRREFYLYDLYFVYFSIFWRKSPILKWCMKQ